MRATTFTRTKKRPRLSPAFSPEGVSRLLGRVFADGRAAPAVARAALFLSLLSAAATVCSGICCGSRRAVRPACAPRHVRGKTTTRMGGVSSPAGLPPCLPFTMALPVPVLRGMGARSKGAALSGLAFIGRCRLAMRISSRGIGATITTLEKSFAEDKGKVAWKKGKHLFRMAVLLLFVVVSGLRHTWVKKFMVTGAVVFALEV